MGIISFKKVVSFFVVLTFCSCSKEKDVIQPIENSSSAFIRTLDFVSSDLVLDDLTTIFSVNLEVNDDANGSLLENIEVFVRFKDNTTNNPVNTSQEILVKTLGKDSFSIGPDGLPRTLLSLSYSELVSVTSGTNIRCGDQFLIRLELNLTNGQSFSADGANSPAVIGFDTTISSPFCYTVNIVNPIPSDQFIGLYRYESITDGPLGPTFGTSKVIELKRGNSVNDRYFEGDYVASRSNEASRKFRFIFTCNQVLFRKNQISSFFTWCPEGNLSGGITFGGPPILLGPSEENGITAINDDSFFELSISEGYEGWNGECGFDPVDVKVRFTKVE